jgi:hypothetical protein
VGLGGFSWKRAVGLSAAKARLSRRIGIPFTKSGRPAENREIGRGWRLSRGAHAHAGHSSCIRDGAVCVGSPPLRRKRKSGGVRFSP